MELGLQFLNDIVHQLRSPLHQASARLRTLLFRGPIPDEIRKELLTIRSLCNQASQELRVLRFLADSARPGDKVTFDFRELAWLIREAVEDYSQVTSHRRINVAIEDSTLRTSPRTAIEANPDMIDTAVRCVLDNAVKYSYEQTTIRVTAARVSAGVAIIVQNRGLPIRPDETERCKDRFYRGNTASRVTGVGSGLGLWVTSQIMDAHNGALEVRPTNSDSLTEVRLVLPTKEVQ